MKKYIHITKEIRLGLVKLFNVTDRMVWAAITFEKDTDIAKRIRKVAVERGGIVMNELPEMETFHDHDGYMRQCLPNGAILELGKTIETRGGAVFFKGEKVRHYDDVMMSDVKGIQDWAKTLR